MANCVIGRLPINWDDFGCYAITEKGREQLRELIWDCLPDGVSLIGDEFMARVDSDVEIDVGEIMNEAKTTMIERYGEGAYFEDPDAPRQVYELCRYQIQVTENELGALCAVAADAADSWLIDTFQTAREALDALRKYETLVKPTGRAALSMGMEWPVYEVVEYAVTTAPRNQEDDVAWGVLGATKFPETIGGVGHESATDKLKKELADIEWRMENSLEATIGDNYMELNDRWLELYELLYAEYENEDEE